MSPKRVTDISDEYAAEPAKDSQIARIKKAAKPIRVGGLEENVDRLLRTKGWELGARLGGDGGNKSSSRRGGRTRRLRRR